MGTEVRTTQTCYSNKTGAAESSRCIMQGLLLPRWMLNPAPQPSSNLRQLPRAVGLERSSHGVTQSKMLTNFHMLSYENKMRLVLVHYPSKLSKPIYNKLSKGISTITKLRTQNPTTSIIHYTSKQWLKWTCWFIVKTKHASRTQF